VVITSVFSPVGDDSSSKSEETAKSPVEVKKEGEAEKSKETANDEVGAMRSSDAEQSRISLVFIYIIDYIDMFIQNNYSLRVAFQVIAIPDDDEEEEEEERKSPPTEQESKKNGEEPMETDTPSNGEKEKEGEMKSSEGGEETKSPSEAKVEGSEVKSEDTEVKGKTPPLFKRSDTGFIFTELKTKKKWNKCLKKCDQIKCVISIYYIFIYNIYISRENVSICTTKLKKIIVSIFL